MKKRFEESGSGSGSQEVILAPDLGSHPLTLAHARCRGLEDIVVDITLGVEVYLAWITE